MKKNIAIFASGSGTNAENIVRFFKNSGSVEIRLIVSNKKDAYVLERAKQLGVPSIVFPKEEWMDGEKILQKMQECSIDFIVLAGFLLKVPDCLMAHYPQKIVNIHPALLPKHGGKGMYGDRVHEQVVACGDTLSGITIHYINSNYDEGSTIFQATCQVLPSDTPEQVAKKVHALEYKHYPAIINKVLSEL